MYLTSNDLNFKSMSKQTMCFSQSCESRRERWTRSICLERSISQKLVQERIYRLESLLDHMLHGHAVVAFHRKDGEFRLTKATLIRYDWFFRKPFSINEIKHTIPYWDVSEQGWRTFELENFLEWRPVA